jgi:hypothetical protein
MQLVRFNEKMIELVLTISNISQLQSLCLCGFRKQTNGSFKRGKQTIIPISDKSIFIHSDYDENLANLITNLSRDAFR